MTEKKEILDGILRTLTELESFCEDKELRFLISALDIVLRQSLMSYVEHNKRDQARVVVNLKAMIEGYEDLLEKVKL